MARPLPVAGRGKDLFGADGAGAVAGRLEADPADSLQPTPFPEFDAAPMPPPHRGVGRVALTAIPGCNRSMPPRSTAGTPPYCCRREAKPTRCGR